MEISYADDGTGWLGQPTAALVFARFAGRCGHATQSQLRLVISDNGPGIPPELRSRVRAVLHQEAGRRRNGAGAKGLRYSALAIGQPETGGARGQGKGVQATAEHREPCDSRPSPCTARSISVKRRWRRS